MSDRKFMQAVNELIHAKEQEQARRDREDAEKSKAFLLESLVNVLGLEHAQEIQSAGVWTVINDEVYLVVDDLGFQSMWTPRASWCLEPKKFYLAGVYTVGDDNVKTTGSLIVEDFDSFARVIRSCQTAIKASREAIQSRVEAREKRAEVPAHVQYLATIPHRYKIDKLTNVDRMVIALMQFLDEFEYFENMHAADYDGDDDHGDDDDIF